MPDESCRKCGGALTRCTVCSECRGITSQICILCGTMTQERFHSTCFYFVEEVPLIQEESLRIIQ